MFKNMLTQSNPVIQSFIISITAIESSKTDLYVLREMAFLFQAEEQSFRRACEVQGG